jgi:hypothetical protein
LDASSKPAIDVAVSLKRSGTVIWQAKTDNSGKAELWVDVYQKSETINLSTLQLVAGSATLNNVVLSGTGINTINLSTTQSVSDKVELAFVVDATGSMGDELEYLKTELLDVINRAKTIIQMLRCLPVRCFTAMKVMIM